MRFDRRAFRVLLEREEWSVRDLAHAAQLSSRTIWGWLTGARKPRLTEWRMAAEALALDPCGHCGGSGTITPTAADIAAITRSVERRDLHALPSPEPLITSDGWTLDRNRLALTIDCTTIRTTRQEANLLTLLADAGGSFVTIAQLGVALKITDHAIHTYLARLKDKCRAADVDLGQVVQNGHGAGYRAVMATRTEASA